jgi:hypothetical protein
MANEEELTDGRKLVSHNPPTLVVDGVLGHSYSGGLFRLFCVEHIMDPSPDATKPKIRPSINLALGRKSAEALRNYLSEILNDPDHAE